MTSAPSTPFDSPRPSVADVQRLVAARVSLPSRVGHALLLVAALTMATAVGSLWATEPSLPARTRIAFALIVSIALAWAAFATWVLRRRQVLFGADRVVAARMGFVFSAIGTAGLATAGYASGAGRAAYIGAAAESTLCVAALILLVRARRHVEAMRRRKQELERQFGIASPSR
jgi:hypothetical protein